MCGLIGWFGPRRPGIEAAIERGVQCLVHRGPDGAEMTWIEPRAYPDTMLVFGHTRLKVLDLTDAAGQPMKDPQSGNVVIYNGAIYNFARLRSLLEAEGVKFKSTGDTEVLLKAYGRWGVESLNKLVGMFAFALWDESRQQCVLARDHVGIKPLYMARVDGAVLFGSEIRALLGTDLLPRRLEPTGLDSFLAYGAVQGPGTLIAGIESVPAASYVAISPRKSAEPVRYWRIPFSSETEESSRKQAAERLREILAGVVCDHLVSDVSVGAFLSGGVDSSSLVILMREAGICPVHTFSVGFAEPGYSEDQYSRLVAKRFSHEHTEVKVSVKQCLDVLPEALRAQDQPSIDGINIYAISDAVRPSGITVVLSGQGGDELFAGYPTFSRVAVVARNSWAWRLPLPVRAAGVALWRLMRRGRRIGDKIAALLMSDGDPLQVYLVLRTLFDHDTRRRLIDPAYLSPAVWGLSYDFYRALHDEAARLDAVNRVSLFELTTYLENMLLRDGDFMSMAHSLELRVPYLDRRIVEFVAGLSGHLKLSRKPAKGLLIDAMQGALPRPIYARPKQGFTFPWDAWLRAGLRPVVAATLDEERAGETIGLRPGAAQDLWRAFLDRRPGITWSRVWAVYVLVEWCQRMGVTK